MRRHFAVRKINLKLLFYNFEGRFEMTKNKNKEIEIEIDKHLMIGSITYWAYKSLNFLMRSHR